MSQKSSKLREIAKKFNISSKKVLRAKIKLPLPYKLWAQWTVPSYTYHIHVHTYKKKIKNEKTPFFLFYNNLKWSVKLRFHSFFIVTEIQATTETLYDKQDEFWRQSPQQHQFSNFWFWKRCHLLSKARTIKQSNIQDGWIFQDLRKSYLEFFDGFLLQQEQKIHSEIIVTIQL